MKQSRLSILCEKIRNILEARSHPDKNPKIGRAVALKRYYDEEIQLPKNEYRYFISFTEINKIGVNPQNPYNTPMGIYAYPLKLVYKDLINDTIPFASRRPYIQLLEIISDKIWNFDEYFEPKMKKDIETLKSIYSGQLDEVWEKHGHGESWEKYIMDRIDDYIEEENQYYGLNLGKMVGIYTWLYSKNIAQIVKGDNYITFWNSIIQKLGYDVVIDSGHSIIHPKEPCQALFLKKSAFRQIEMIINKRYSTPDELYQLAKSYT